ncbi:MAG: hypothetical protein AB7Q42_13950 [Acidimicrobiia bacterium]
MLDLAALATALVTSFLVPLFKRSADGVASDLQQRAGDAIAERASGLWQRVKQRFAGTPKAGVIDTFEADPDLVREAVERVVKELLESDEAFREQAAAFMKEAAPGDTRWHLEGEIVGAVDARHAQISGGQTAGVIVEGTRTPTPQTPPPGEASG